MISTRFSLTTTASSTFPNSTPLIEYNISTSNYLYTPSSTIDLYNASNVSGFNDTFSSVFPSYIRTTSVVFCIIIMCLGVIGNIMVPIVIFKTKDMRNSTNIFLVNLSVADLMVLLVCTPTVLVEVNSRPETWVLGKEMCKAVPFVELTVAHASVLTILAISFERYYAICKPLKAGYICTKTRASLICLLAWFIAALFTSPILAITQYGPEEYVDGSIVFVCFSLVEDTLPCVFFLSSILVFFIFPLAILIIVYILIAKTLMRHPVAMTGTKSVLPSQSAIKYRKQVILMLGAVVLAFFLCLLPFRALTFWIIVAPPGSNFEIGFENYYNILYFARIMFHINSAVNPILYNIISSKFRGGFLRLCGVKVVKRRRKDKREITRKSTNSSTHTSSQQTSDSFLHSSKRHSEKKCSSLREIKEAGDGPEGAANVSREDKGREVYVRAPLGHKFSNGEIYV
ncbi:growth hormone secretagogue receptor type 1 isoform X1 [Zophobas morio]|uniref:growth hormone secretagogue receptor type 1 isoform X1 n=1 Tax=Zophobas morio TaxID=2755281 RepID=UPI003083283A